MPKKLALAVVLLGVLTGPALADPSCEGPGFDHDGMSAQALRAVAASCDNRAMGRLYYNRAYHLDLLEHFQALSQVLVYRGPDSRVHAQSYRTLIGLYEAFARRQWRQGQREEALRALNEGYEKAAAVAELRLKGHDNLADRLAASQY